MDFRKVEIVFVAFDGLENGAVRFPNGLYGRCEAWRPDTGPSMANIYTGLKYPKHKGEVIKASMKYPFIWDMIQHTVGVMEMPHTSPAFKCNGWMVGGWTGDQKRRWSAYPSDLKRPKKFSYTYRGLHYFGGKGWRYWWDAIVNEAKERVLCLEEMPDCEALFIQFPVFSRLSYVLLFHQYNDCWKHYEENIDKVVLNLLKMLQKRIKPRLWTVVSDHGFTMKRGGHKWHTQNGTFAMWGKNIPEKKIALRNLDVPPTFLDALGLSIPEYLEGVSAFPK